MRLYAYQKSGYSCFLTWVNVAVIQKADDTYKTE